jgi:tRNA synthetase class II (G, H, P, S and T)
MRHIPGLEWQTSGQAVISGPLLDAFRSLDGRFARWAREAGAEDYRFPTFLPARELHRLDYFRSFPHLVTFPVALDEDPESLRAFVADEPLRADGAVLLGKPAPVREVLTPAACYHFYVMLQGQEVRAPLNLTTVATCFRREAYYRPLQRQWNFTMRELVRIGSAEEVEEFLNAVRQRAEGLIAALDLPVEWRPATDPFFDPTRSPKHVAQLVDPVKTEMVYDGELAIGSVNLHRNFFGDTFGITRDGEPAFSGCVAFGLERWLYALLTRHGPDPRAWPSVVAEAP